MPNSEIKTFAEFWPYYVGEHSKRATRVLHYCGTAIATGSLVWLIATGRWYFFPLAFIPGYAFAWVAHFLVEHNKPATFKHPLWSFISDYKMFGMMLLGRMNRAEIERCIERTQHLQTH
jgi:hypothetical protein